MTSTVYFNLKKTAAHLDNVCGDEAGLEGDGVLGDINRLVLLVGLSIHLPQSNTGLLRNVRLKIKLGATKQSC